MCSKAITSKTTLTLPSKLSNVKTSKVPFYPFRQISIATGERNQGAAYMRQQKYNQALRHQEDGQQFLLDTIIL